MNKRRGERDRIREEFWRGALRKRETSGLTVREFCRRERLHESTYHFWRRELKRRDAESVASQRGQQFQVERTRANRHNLASVAVVRPIREGSRIRARAALSKAARFVPVTVAALDNAVTAAEIVLPGACVVRVARGCDRETLGMVLSILEERPC